jgi:mannose-P-dolichol utilization defect 1
MIIQTLIIILMFVYYSKFSFATNSLFFMMGLGYFYGIYAMFNVEIVNEKNLSLLQSLTIPLFSLSRLTQIVTLLQVRNSDSISIISTFMQFGGSAARVFTTLNEVDDVLILSGFLVGLVLNGTLLVLVIFFKSSKVKKE